MNLSADEFLSLSTQLSDRDVRVMELEKQLEKTRELLLVKEAENEALIQQLVIDLKGTVDLENFPLPYEGAYAQALYLLDHGFNVKRVYADSIPGGDRAAFEALQREHPDLLLYPTVHAGMRFANSANTAGMAGSESDVLALGQKAAYFEGSDRFVNIVEGGGMNGYEAVTRTMELMRDAYINKKDIWKTYPVLTNSYSRASSTTGILMH